MIIFLILLQIHSGKVWIDVSSFAQPKNSDPLVNFLLGQINQPPKLRGLDCRTKARQYKSTTLSDPMDHPYTFDNSISITSRNTILRTIFFIFQPNLILLNLLSTFQKYKTSFIPHFHFSSIFIVQAPHSIFLHHISIQSPTPHCNSSHSFDFLFPPDSTSLLLTIIIALVTQNAMRLMIPIEVTF